MSKPTKLTKAEIKKQMEFWLGDENLARDEFFRGKITENSEGYIALDLFLNCNKFKKAEMDVKQMAEGIKGSTLVELKKDGKMVRRTDNKELPALVKKRDGKAMKKEQGGKKEEEKVEEPEDEEVKRDELGRIIFKIADFEEPKIVHFKTDERDEAKDTDYKVNWKDLEKMVSSKFDKIKVVYSRADKYEGDIAISKCRLNKEQFEKLSTLQNEMVGDKKFNFSETSGEDLKDFWQNQGGHYQFCIAPKMRGARKNQKKANDIVREEKAKKQKQSYEIAGVYYMDINKVKSKSRAILNIRKDGEKLEPSEEEFTKEIMKFHTRSEEKMADFTHFEVGIHPEFNKTRCFFIVRKDGSKEDFSVSKCIQNLEQQVSG